MDQREGRFRQRVAQVVGDAGRERGGRGISVAFLGRAEFRRTPSWWDRITSWFGDIADHLSFSWLGPVGQFLLWLLLVAAVVALATIGGSSSTKPLTSRP